MLLRADFGLAQSLADGCCLSAQMYTYIPIIRALHQTGCALIVASSLGNHADLTQMGSFSSLRSPLSEALGADLTFLPQWPLQKTYLAPATIALAENVAIVENEYDDSQWLIDKMLQGVDLFILDAFSCSHRFSASTLGALQFAENACVGPRHQRELIAMHHFCQADKPRLGLLGGANLAVKLQQLTAMVTRFDIVCVGGGLANTWLYSLGYQLGRSWVDYTQLKVLKSCIQHLEKNGVKVLLPLDFVVSEDVDGFSTSRIAAVGDIQPHETVVDLGPDTLQLYSGCVDSSSTVYWSGPMGCDTYTLGCVATQRLGQHIVNAPVYSLVTGAGTLACFERLGVSGFSHVSSGGDAFLHFLKHGSTKVAEFLQANDAWSPLVVVES